jgi:hypothetical protein
MTPWVRSLATAESVLKGTGLAVTMFKNACKKTPADGTPRAPTLSGRFTATAAKDTSAKIQRAAPLAHPGATKVPLGHIIAPSASLASMVRSQPPKTIRRASCVRKTRTRLQAATALSSACATSVTRRFTHRVPRRQTMKRTRLAFLTVLHNCTQCVSRVRLENIRIFPGHRIAPCAQQVSIRSLSRLR